MRHTLFFLSLDLTTDLALLALVAPLALEAGLEGRCACALRFCPCSCPRLALANPVSRRALWSFQSGDTRTPCEFERVRCPRAGNSLTHRCCFQPRVPNHLRHTQSGARRSST